VRMRRRKPFIFRYFLLLFLRLIFIGFYISDLSGGSSPFPRKAHPRRV
jgi:hypothetical protein